MPITLNNFPEYRPYSNVQPFTVRDGATYLLQLEALKDWLRDYVIPHINKEVGELSETWIAQTTALIENWEQLSIALINQVNEVASGVAEDAAAAEAAKAAAEAARDLAEQFASQAQDVQDASVTTILNDVDSQLRTALDGLYAPLVGYSSLVDVIANGRLSVGTLDGRFDAKADKSYVDAGSAEVDGRLDAVESGLTQKASIAVQETVENGRLSAAILDETYGSKSGQDALVADVASIPRQGYGVLNPAKKYREVGCVIRRVDSNTWEFIDDGNHVPTGVASVTMTSTYVQIVTNFAGKAVVTACVTPDESFSQAAVRVGASVGLSQIRIYFYMGAAGTAPVNPGLLSAAGANVWVYGLFEVA